MRRALSRLFVLLPAALAGCAAPPPPGYGPYGAMSYPAAPYPAPDLRQPTRLPPPEQGPPVRTLSGAPRGDQRLVSAMLAAHNGERARYGYAPLAWDNALAAAAEAYAGEMARTDVFRHDPTPGRRKLMGENLFRGTRGGYSYAQMAGFWLDERRMFRPGIFPSVATTGNWADIGHYTQLIWPTTSRVGCAVASSRRYDYLVCRYSPAGNKDGQSVGR